MHGPDDRSGHQFPEHEGRDRACEHPLLPPLCLRGETLGVRVRAGQDLGGPGRSCRVGRTPPSPARERYGRDKTERGCDGGAEDPQHRPCAAAFCVRGAAGSFVCPAPGPVRRHRDPARTADQSFVLSRGPGRVRDPLLCPWGNRVLPPAGSIRPGQHPLVPPVPARQREPCRRAPFAVLRPAGHGTLPHCAGTRPDAPGSARCIRGPGRPRAGIPRPRPAGILAAVRRPRRARCPAAPDPRGRRGVHGLRGPAGRRTDPREHREAGLDGPGAGGARELRALRFPGRSPDGNRRERAGGRGPSRCACGECGQHHDRARGQGPGVPGRHRAGHGDEFPEQCAADRDRRQPAGGGREGSESPGELRDDREPGLPCAQGAAAAEGAGRAEAAAVCGPHPGPRPSHHERDAARYARALVRARPVPDRVDLHGAGRNRGRDRGRRARTAGRSPARDRL